MIKYWGKILLENSYINHCGMKAGKDCWLSGAVLARGSPPYPPQRWIHSSFASVSTGCCYVSLTVKRLSSEHQPSVKTSACRYVQENTYHNIQPTAGLPMQSVTMLTCIETHQQWGFFPWNLFVLSTEFSRKLPALFVLSAASLRQTSVSVAVWVGTGYVQNETHIALLDNTSGNNSYIHHRLHGGSVPFAAP